LSIQYWSSLIILSLTLRQLEFSWSTLALDQERKEGKRKEGASKEEQDQAITTVFLQVSIYMCFFLARFCIHGITCGYFVVMAWVFPGVIMFSA